MENLARKIFVCYNSRFIREVGAVKAGWWQRGGMSQSLLYHAFGVREGYEYRSTKYVEGRLEFHLAVKEEGLQCPHCQGREYWRRGKRQRRINTLPIGPSRSTPDKFCL